MSSLKARMLTHLRQQMRRLEKPGAAGRHALSLGPAPIDEALPAGGLAGGCLHEIAGAAGDAAVYGFAASLLARVGGSCGVALWCRIRHARTIPYCPALAGFGLTPARAIFAAARDQAEILWAMEEA